MGKKWPNFRYHKTGKEKEKENPTSLAEEAQEEETTWALGSHVLDNPLQHTSSSSIRMTEEEEEEEEVT